MIQLPTVKQSLRKRFFLTFLLLGLGAVASVASVIQTQVAPHLIAAHRQHTVQVMRTVIAELGQLTASTASLTTALADIAAHLPHEDQLLNASIPHMLGNNNRHSLVAGGGIWPEPHSYHRDAVRASFFWGRQPDGTLLAYDDYNATDGQGYHHEEWYAPARYAQPRQVLWSQSYMDPHSHEPMVTCSIPYHTDEGTFAGVATVDLKLDGLQSFFTRHAKPLSGYIFAVDRNYRLLTYPDITTEPTMHSAMPLPTLDAYVDTHPHYAPIATLLADTHRTHLQHVDGQRTAQLAQALERDSYHINGEQSQRLAAHILRPQLPHSATAYATELYTYASCVLAEDPIFHTTATATVYSMPSTDWHIIVVRPHDVADAAVTAIMWSTLLSLSAALICCVALAYLILRRSIITPLHTIIQTLMAHADSTHADYVSLPEIKQGDIGLLAHWFNRHSQALHTAHEKIIAENTRRIHTETELQKAHYAVTSSLHSLSKSEASLASMLNSFTHGVIATSNTGIILRCNPVAHALTGWVCPHSDSSSNRNAVLILANPHDEHIRRTHIQNVLQIFDCQSPHAALSHTLLDASEQKLSCLLQYIVTETDAEAHTKTPTEAVTKTDTAPPVLRQLISLHITPMLDTRDKQTGLLFVFEKKEHVQ